MVQTAIYNALGLRLNLPLLQPQGDIYVFLYSLPLVLEQGQLGVLAVLVAFQLYQLSLKGNGSLLQTASLHSSVKPLI